MNKYSIQINCNYFDKKGVTLRTIKEEFQIGLLMVLLYSFTFVVFFVVTLYAYEKGLILINSVWPILVLAVLNVIPVVFLWLRFVDKFNYLED